LLSLLKEFAYDAVMLSGVSFGGFNLVDLRLIVRTVRKPAIAVIGQKPDNRAVREALQKHFGDWRERWRAVRNAGPLYSCRPLRAEPKLYFEARGCSPAAAERIICSSSLISRLPEPVRVAGLLARGVGLVA